MKERDWKEKKLDGYWAEMKRCLRLLKVFAKVSLMSQLEYRANFVAGVAVETGWMLIKLLYVAVVYRVGADIGVLTPDHILLFVGIYTLMTGFTCSITGTSPPSAGWCGRGAGSVSGQAGVPAISRHHAAAGCGPAAAGLRRRGDHDLPGMGEGRAAGDLRFRDGIFVLHGLRNPADLQPVFAAAPVVLLDRGHQGGGGNDLGDWDFNNMPQLIYGKWMQRIGTFLLPSSSSPTSPACFSWENCPRF